MGKRLFKAVGGTWIPAVSDGTLSSFTASTWLSRSPTTGGEGATMGDNVYLYNTGVSDWLPSYVDGRSPRQILYYDLGDTAADLATRGYSQTVTGTASITVDGSGITFDTPTTGDFGSYSHSEAKVAGESVYGRFVFELDQAVGMVPPPRMQLRCEDTVTTGEVDISGTDTGTGYKMGFTVSGTEFIEVEIPYTVGEVVLEATTFCTAGGDMWLECYVNGVRVSAKLITSFVAGTGTSDILWGHVNISGSDLKARFKEVRWYGFTL